MSDDVKLGYIGLGNMGAPMAKRLVDWPGGLIVFDVRTEAMTPLAEAGATLADSVADVAAADIISVTVLNDEQVREVVGELAAHAKPGTVIAIHSTISPTPPSNWPNSCEPQGHSHRRCTGQRRRPARPRRVSWPSWSAPTDEAFELVKPAFEQWASLVVHAGEPGAGTRMKLARNMLTSSRSPPRARRQKLAEAAGIDLQELGKVVRHTDAHHRRARRDHVPRRHETACARTTSCTSLFVHTRGLGEKDLSLALALGEAIGVDLPLAEVALKNLAAGLGVPHTSTRRSDAWTNCARRASRR